MIDEPSKFYIWADNSGGYNTLIVTVGTDVKTFYSYDSEYCEDYWLVEWNTTDAINQASGDTITVDAAGSNT